MARGLPLAALSIAVPTGPEPATMRSPALSMVTGSLIERPTCACFPPSFSKNPPRHRRTAKRKDGRRPARVFVLFHFRLGELGPVLRRVGFLQLRGVVSDRDQ